MTQPLVDGYRLRADQHRPDGAEIAEEIRRLHRDGLMPQDISEALHIGVAAVLQAIRGNA